MHQPILIIACGGKSERMGTDKCLLDYHGKPQYQHLEELLKPHFPEIYFSIRKEQVISFDSCKNIITDNEKVAGHGPISGLLSCIEVFPKRNLLFIGCDYPLLLLEDVKKLTSDLLPESSSAYFDLYYEPLLAFYNKNCFKELISEYNNGNYSLQNFLNKISAIKIIADDKKRIKGIDTLEEFKAQFTK